MAAADDGFAVVRDIGSAPVNGSLAERFPRDTVLLVVLWAAAALALGAGLLAPAVRVTRLRLFDTTHSVLSGIADLAAGGSLPLAVVVAVFSVAFPIAKLGLAAWLWFAPRAGDRAHHVAGAIGKWSMLDVLVVAVVVASLQGGFMVRLRPEAGIYLFALSTILAMALGALIERRRRAVEGG